MGVLFIFILISVLVVSALLFFNKGEKSQEIKSILKEIYENFKELLSNFKKLFLIVKELIQAKLDQKPTQLKDDSAESQPEETAEPEVIAEPEVTPETESLPISESETSSEASSQDKNIDIKPSNF